MPTFYVFESTTGTALAITDDETGKKLPGKAVGQWRFSRNIELMPGDRGLIGVDADTAIEAIRRTGYYEYPSSN